MEAFEQQHLSGMELLETAFGTEEAARLYENAEDGDTSGFQFAEETFATSADIFAGSVLLVLDDLLHRYAAMLGISAHGVHLLFGEQFNGVYLTTLIAAAGNNFRHVREWETLAFPYPTLSSATGKLRQQLESINPLLTALGRSGPIREYVTRHVLVRIAGSVNVHRSSGSKSLYAVVEDKVLDAMAEMAVHGGWFAETAQAKSDIVLGLA